MNRFNPFHRFARQAVNPAAVDGAALAEQPALALAGAVQDGGIVIENLRKVYGTGDAAVVALKNVNMQVAPGEVVGLVGPSGSGKSTLLKCLGAIIEPTAGRMTLGREVIYDNGWRTADLRALRRDRIGFVFQAPYLIPFLDVTDNVALLPMLAGVPNALARQRALELLAALDVLHRAQAQTGQLSGGEQQRVSIARALANRPPVILADEPTAPLDSERALGVMRILNRMAREARTAIIVVTHDEKIIPTFRRIYHIRDGQTVEEAGEGRALEGRRALPWHAPKRSGLAVPLHPLGSHWPSKRGASLPFSRQFESAYRCRQAAGLVAQAAGRCRQLFHQRGVLLCHLVELADGEVHLVDAIGLLAGSGGHVGYDLGHALNRGHDLVHGLPG